MPEENGNLKETELVLKEWEVVITTQMHFNEMIIRARTTGVSVVMAVYGTAAIALGQYPKMFLVVSGFTFHVSAAIIFFGILLLWSIFFVDYFYYFRLLLGAVERGEEIDAAYRDQAIGKTRLFGMTTLISRKVSRCRAVASLLIFYGSPFIAGVLFLIYMLWLYSPAFYLGSDCENQVNCL